MRNLTSFNQSAAGNVSVKNKKVFSQSTFSSTAAGFGVPLSSANTAANKIYSDDGGTALTSGNLRGLLSRVLIPTAVTAGTFSLRAVVGQVKITASIVTTGHIAGIEGYIETVSGGHIDRATAVRGMVDLPSSAVIHTSGVLSAFMAYSLDLGGTHTGKAAVIDVPTPGAGTWDALLWIDASTGCTATGTTKTTPGGVDVWAKAYIGTTLYYVPCYASTTA
jgi:hypothetical protein